MTETAIADQRLTGDLQTAALVTTDGSIDWFYAPRFDSPSVFGALLDDERGGRFRIRPAGTEYTSKRAYFPGTAVLVTRFFTADGLDQVVEFMPNAATDNRQLVRILQCVRGRISFELELPPTRLRPPAAPHRGDRERCGLHGGRDAAGPARGSRARRRTARAGTRREPGRLVQGHVENQDVHGSIAAVVGWVLARVVFRAALFVVGGLAGGGIGAKLSGLLEGDDGNVLLAVVFAVAVAALTGLAVQRYHDRRHLALRVRWRRFGLSGVGRIWPNTLGVLRTPDTTVEAVLSAAA